MKLKQSDFVAIKMGDLETREQELMWKSRNKNSGEIETGSERTELVAGEV
ncbi:MAG: hypothetical protein IPM86_02880 [Saprospiraceae bacterium]|nr:hypothetical protein [Saprospiraceae bacterium]